MPHGFASHSQDAREHERGAVEQVAERLHYRFPELPDNEIDELVAAHYRQLQDRPIRDFVPVLVERATRAELNNGSADRA